jgi:hypothetical protein
MSTSDLEAKLRSVIAQAIDENPTASPVDLVRWARHHYAAFIAQYQRKLADDKIESLCSEEIRRREMAQPSDSKTKERETQPPQEKPEPAQGEMFSKSTASINTHNPLKHGRPRFGHPNQSRLPFSEQFERIPYYLILEPRTRSSRGREIELPNATLADLKKRRAFIKGEQSMELPQLNRLIQLMQAYDKMHPGITVKKAMELRSTARRQDKDKQA